jgi:hypothetical protein
MEFLNKIVHKEKFNLTNILIKKKTKNIIQIRPIEIRYKLGNKRPKIASI